MAEKRGFNPSGKAQKRVSDGTGAPCPSGTDKQQAEERKKQHDLFDDLLDDDDNSDDEIVVSVSSKADKSKYLFILAGVAVVLIVIVVFLVFRLGSESSEPPVQYTPSVPDTSLPTPAPEVIDGTAGLGTQDFTKNTNMTSSSVLTDPDSYTKDIHGLTIQVGYTVQSITNVADFVSYTKQRGTWGGGLELYWLDAEYQGNKYVVQVPFKYYKELADEGIIPVKMEVLTIEGSTPQQTLNVISYMTLDETTLKSILKQQGKK